MSCEGVPVKIESISPEYFGLHFEYDAMWVNYVKSLGSRKWNGTEKRWEVHVRHLGEVMKYFRVPTENVDKKLMRTYQMSRIRNATTKIHVGNVTAQLVGSGLPLQQIVDATSFYVPGYKFMPRFVSGKWDGRKHLFNKKKLTFPAGLVPRVMELLAGQDIECEVVREPETECAVSPTNKPHLVLRDYQQECVDAALKQRRGVLELATGAGKTAVATYLIHLLGKRALFLVHTRDLLHQTIRYMKDQLGVEIGQIGDGVVDIQPICVATVQTCARALDIAIDETDEGEKPEKDPTDVATREEEIADFIRTVPVVFFDECHHLPAECCYELSMQTKAACYRFGLSATPYRSDRQDLLLEAAVGAKIYRANASVLIEKGYLVPPEITFTELPPLSYHGKRPGYQDIYEQYVVEHGYRNRLIAERAKALAAKKQSVLILVSQVRHGMEIAKLCPEAVLVQGSDVSDVRREVFSRLEKKQQLIVIATTLADEGLDIPTLNAVILASGGKSETRALQRLGRALRCAKGKTKALVFDFVDNAPYLSEHSKKRLEIFKSEPKFTVKVEKKQS